MNKKYIIIMISIIGIILLVLLIMYTPFANKNNDILVEIEKVYEANCNANLYDGEWITISEKNIHLLERYNVEFKDIDITRNNYILSECRKIKRISYKEKNKLPIGYEGEPIFEDVSYPNKIFLHKIDKSIKLFQDMKATPKEMKVESP